MGIRYLCEYGLLTEVLLLFFMIKCNSETFEISETISRACLHRLALSAILVIQGCLVSKYLFAVLTKSNICARASLKAPASINPPTEAYSLRVCLSMSGSTVPSGKIPSKYLVINARELFT